MPDVIHELYEKHAYPAMSHPSSDPAVAGVAARMAGLRVPHPRQAMILEVGCCSGHNLIPLALRWPESKMVGIDLSERSIREAVEAAAAAGAGNVEFYSGDLRDFDSLERQFDFIIAHGFFSWVPDEVKAALLIFCRKHLSPSGIATISFNLECGWKPRLPVIEKVRAIRQATGGDVISSLEILGSLADLGAGELSIIHDMLAKGATILEFDDFGPINDPWSLAQFTAGAGRAGLRWLGESNPAENVISMLGDKVILALKAEAEDSLAFQSAMDEAAGRTFRSGILCRDDAPVEDRVPLEMVVNFSLRVGSDTVDEKGREICEIIRSSAPACVPAAEVLAAMPGGANRERVRQVFEGINHGWLRARLEPMSYNPVPPEFPKLDGFRMYCAQNGLPLVDAWHGPCSFPPLHYQVLAAMDGSHSRRDLAKFSNNCSPELAFQPWLEHLAWRGMLT